MRRKIHFLLFLFLCMASIPLAAQDIEVKGVVTEATTNEPLPGVTVRVKDKDTGTITDADGNILEVYPNGFNPIEDTKITDFTFNNGLKFKL